MESSESFSWKKVIDDKREHMVRFSLLLAIGHAMNMIYRFDNKKKTKLLKNYTSFFYNNVWNKEDIENLIFYEKVINNSEEVKNTIHEKKGQLFSDLNKIVDFEDNNYRTRISLQSGIFLIFSILSFFGLGIMIIAGISGYEISTKLYFAFSLLSVSFLTYAIRGFYVKKILNDNNCNPKAGFIHKIRINDIFDKLKEESEVIRSLPTKDTYFTNTEHALAFSKLSENPGYETLKQILPETEEYFRALIKLSYIKVGESGGPIKCYNPFSKSSFYELLHDNEFLFLNIRSQITDEVLKQLIDSKLNVMQNRSGTGVKGYRAVKEALINLKVPMTKL